MRIALFTLWLTLPASTAQSAQPASAQPSNDASVEAALGRARQLYTTGYYDACTASLDDLLLRADLPAAARDEALSLAAFSHSALGHGNAARARFRELLLHNPQRTLPAEISPKIKAIFEEVRQELMSAPALQPAEPFIRTAPLALGATRVTLAFVAKNATRVILHWRVTGETAYRDLARDTPTLAGVSFELDLPPGTGEIEWHGEALGERGKATGIGSAGQPQRQRIVSAAPQRLPGTQPVSATQPVITPAMASATAGEPIYKQWWLWTTVGLVAGGVVAAVLLTRPTTGGLSVHLEPTP